MKEILTNIGVENVLGFVCSILNQCVDYVGAEQLIFGTILWDELLP